MGKKQKPQKSKSTKRLTGEWTEKLWQAHLKAQHSYIDTPKKKKGEK